jgi:multiple sugar transport system substrate-binding protein
MDGVGSITSTSILLVIQRRFPVKRLFVILLMVALVAFMGSAQIKEIKILHDNPEFQTYWTDAGEASGKEAGVRAVSTNYETEVYQTKVKADLTSNNAPAVFKWWFGYRAYSLLKAGLVADLGDVWKEIGSNYAPGLKEALTIDGTTYALPFNVGYWVWYYSKPVYAKYNLTLPKTWDEWMKQLDFLKSKGVYGIGNTVGDSRWTSFIVFQEILYRLDADFYTRLMTGKAHYTDPTVVKAMQIWKDLVDKGIMAPNDVNYTTDIPRMMKEGSLAFAPFGDWYSGILQGQGLKPNQDYGVWIPPAINKAGQGSIVLEVSPLMVGKNCPDVAAAKKWLKWYASSKTSAEILWKDLKWAPSKNMSPEVIARDDPTVTDEMALLKAYPKKLIRFWEATPEEIVEHAVAQFNEFRAGSSDKYMDQLKSIEAKAKEIWPKYGVTNY